MPEEWGRVKCAFTINESMGCAGGSIMRSSVRGIFSFLYWLGYHCLLHSCLVSTPAFPNETCAASCSVLHGPEELSFWGHRQGDDLVPLLALFNRTQLQLAIKPSHLSPSPSHQNFCKVHRRAPLIAHTGPTWASAHSSHSAPALSKVLSFFGERWGAAYAVKSTNSKENYGMVLISPEYYTGKWA